jgi:type II secretory pathway component PulM
MIRSMTAIVAIAALIVVGAMLWQPQSHSIELTAAAMPSLVELHAMAGVEKLPVQEIDDQSLIYSTPAK